MNITKNIMDFAREIELLLWGIVIGYTFLFGIFALKRIKSAKLVGVAGITLIMMAIGQSIGIVANFWIYEPNLQFLVERISIIVDWIGFMVLIFNLERTIIKTHYAFTAVALTVIALYATGIDLRNPNIPLVFVVVIYALIISATLSLPLLYAYIGLRATGEIRKRSLITGFGIFVFFAGIALLRANVSILAPEAIVWYESTFHIPYSTLPPSMMIFGVLLIAYGLNLIRFYE